MSQHPLRPILETTPKSVKLQSSSQNDPFATDTSLDPLSKMVADVSLKERQEVIRLNEQKASFEPWSFKKSAILSKYTTSEKLSIQSSFLTPVNSGAAKEKTTMTGKNISTVSDKIKDRLEQLEQFDDENMQEMANLSQQDYMKRIDELNNALLQAWSEDDRVKSLKIVIQVIIRPQKRKNLEK